MELKNIATLSESFKSFVQSGNYESYILELMNRSTVVFPGKYTYHKDQSCNQCDFYDIETHEKFEAKLPFDKKEGELICSNHGNLKKWFEFMMNEEAEFGERIILERGKYSIDDLRLYKTLSKRINTVQEDENAIFFFPYPITFDMEGNGEVNLLHYCGDILSAIFGQLKRNGIIKNRQIYTIYPSADEKIVLRCLNTNKREFLVFVALNNIFAYKFSLP